MTTVFIRVRLNLLAGRVAAEIDPADTLGALLVLWLLLSALVANNALVRFIGARRLMPGAGGRSFRMMQLLLTFLDQQLIAEHLPDDLPGLRLGFFPEVAHCGLLSGKNGRDAAMFPFQRIKDRRFFGWLRPTCDCSRAM